MKATLAQTGWILHKTVLQQGKKPRQLLTRALSWRAVSFQFQFHINFFPLISLHLLTKEHLPPWASLPTWMLLSSPLSSVLVSTNFWEILSGSLDATCPTSHSILLLILAICFLAVGRKLTVVHIWFIYCLLTAACCVWEWGRTKTETETQQPTELWIKTMGWDKLLKYWVKAEKVVDQYADWFYPLLKQHCYTWFDKE